MKKIVRVSKVILGKTRDKSHYSFNTFAQIHLNYKATYFYDLRNFTL